jgi:PAS domain S-box-containing protein
VSETGRKTAQLVAELEALRDQLAAVSREAEVLRGSEARYRGLAEHASDLIAELDAEGRVLFVSPSCQPILGYQAQQMIGTTPFSLLHADDVERLADSFLRRVAEGRPPGPGTLFRVRHRDGSWRWLQGRGANYATAEGEPRVVCVCRDVTGQVRAEEERKRLDEWMQQTRRLESLGVLAGGIAHDFNNLLTPILGEACLALQDLPADSPLRAGLERIRAAAQRAAALTAELLDSVGIGSLHLEAVDLSALVGGILQLLEGAVAGRARLVLELDAGLPSVEGDPARLAQVVRNLVENAAEASPEGAALWVRTAAAELDRTALSRAFLGEKLPEGAYLRLEVEDEGAGMEAETRARLFDPFYSTKFTGRGLGLAAVLGIVRAHRGAIEVETAPGRGTRVAVWLPAAGGPTASRSRREASAAEPGAGGTVLVVDDDDAVRELAAETLRRAGFSALCAADGEDAVARLRGCAGGVRAAILDWTLPGTSGGELCDALRRVRPGLPIVLVSGHAPEVASRALGGRAAEAFLQKPFLPAQLVQRVREALGDRVS